MRSSQSVSGSIHSGNRGLRRRSPTRTEGTESCSGAAWTKGSTFAQFSCCTANFFFKPPGYGPFFSAMRGTGLSLDLSSARRSSELLWRQFQAGRPGFPNRSSSATLSAFPSKRPPLPGNSSPAEPSTVSETRNCVAALGRLLPLCRGKSGSVPCLEGSSLQHPLHEITSGDFTTTR